MPGSSPLASLPVAGHWNASGDSAGTVSHGLDEIRAEGATAREAWDRAVEQAAACGMLQDWPRPTGGAG
jgi:hypothetical protein